MKYIIIFIIITIIAVIIGFGLCFLVSSLIRRKMKKKIPIFLHIVISMLSGIIIFITVSGLYLGIHYPADSTALDMLNNENIRETDGAYFIDGEGEDTVFIFYPGAKVDSEAYLPLMKMLSDNGIDCFVIKPPFRFALFDANAADRIIDKYSYKHVIVSGHSMGGTIASLYASKNPDKIDGVVLLSAYPGSEISDNIPLLSIYGSEDMVLNKEAYKNAEPFFPDVFDEVIIDGGSHSGFGSYGEQRGDGKPGISPDQQKEITVNAILCFEKDHVIS